MSFQYPLSLYLLFLIPLIIALYFIKSQKITLKTPAYFLWVQIAEQARPKTVWQQLIRNLTLLLQILIVLFLALAIAKPKFTQGVSADEPVVILIDNSAGMNTKQGDTTRLALAKKQAIELINNLGNSKYLIISAISANNNDSFNFTDTTASAINQINKISSTDAADNFPQLLPVLISNLPKKTKIYIISDMSSPDIAGLSKNYPEVRLIGIGGQADNSAILNVQARRKILSPVDYQIMIRLANYAAGAKMVNLQTQLNNTPLDNRKIHLGANEEKSIIIQGRSEMGGIISCELTHLMVQTPLTLPSPQRGEGLGEGDDAFNTDNKGYDILSDLYDISLLAVNVNNKRLKKALGVLPRLKITALSKKQYEKLAEEQPYLSFDIALFYGFTPDRLLSSQNLIINPQGKSPVKIIKPLSWQRTHPVMNYLELSGLQIKRVNRLKLYPQSRILIKSGQIPILVYDSFPGYNLLRLGFAFKDTDFTLQPSFPMFLFNVMDFFAGQGNNQKAVKLEVGEPYLIPIPKQALTEDTTAFIIQPDGIKKTIPLYKDEDNYYNPQYAGRYQFVFKDIKTDFVVSMPQGESHINPGFSAVSHSSKPGIWRIILGHIESRMLLTFLALGLIVFKWWYRKEKADAVY